MIFLIVALKWEAAPLIARLGLERVPDATRFRVFRKGSVWLVLSGPGGSAAMMATTYLLTLADAGPADAVVNIGIAARYVEGGRDHPGTDGPAVGRMYIARAVRNLALRRSFYPDLLFRIPLPEAEILTSASVYRGLESKAELERWTLPFRRAGRASAGSGSADGPHDPLLPASPSGDVPPQCLRPDAHGTRIVPLLVDMEAAYVFEAASLFVRAHRIWILKVISDDGDVSSVHASMVENMIFRNLDTIVGLLEGMKDEVSGNKDSAQDEVGSRALTDAAAQALRLSAYQKMELMKLSHNYDIRKGTLEPVLGREALRAAFLAAGIAAEDDGHGGAAAHSRREGKVVYEAIRTRLLEP